MVQVGKVLDSRYSLGDAVPGTRSCHHFEPSSTTSIKGKQLSDDHVYTIKDHSFSALPTAGKIALKLKPNNYATCIFDGFWWLVLVDSINVEKKDVTCKFMHPHGPTNNFHRSILMMWDMNPSISSPWLLKFHNFQAMLDGSSLRNKNLSIQIVFLKIWNNITLTIWRYSNLLSYNKRNTNLMHFQMILTFFHWIYH